MMGGILNFGNALGFSSWDASVLNLVILVPRPPKRVLFALPKGVLETRCVLLVESFWKSNIAIPTAFGGLKLTFWTSI